MADSLKGNKCALGYKRTPGEREAIRQRTLGNQQWLGKHHKEESKDKLRRGIVAVAPDGTRQEFTGTKLAGEALGLPYQMIVRLCKSGKPARSGKFAGWQFFYADQEAKPVEIPEEYKDVPRTREAAKATGDTYYFTGVPCTRGHIALRKTKGCCVECQREDWKKY